MVNQNIKQHPILAAIIVWMAINAAFFALMLTSDAMDANNSIILALMIASIAALLFTRKTGYALSIFALIYAFSFNAFNVIYFSADLPFAALIVNLVSAILNVVAFIYLFKLLLQNNSS